MYAVAVAGGGLTGASLAAALADLGLKVAVVEAIPPESPGQPSLDERTSAIARTGVRILERLDVWGRLAEAPSPIRAVEISERGCFGAARIDAASQGLESLGSVVRNRVLGQALWDKLRESDGVDLFCPATVDAVTVESGQVRIRVDGGGKTLRARLLAVAEGAHSPLRREFGIEAEHREYPQTALTGLAEVRRVIRPDTAWERFTADGPLALLPAGGRRYGFVIVSNQGAEKLAAMDGAAVLSRLQKLAGYRAGEFVAVGPRAVYPLALHWAQRITAPRSVLVGAAANSVHPLVAQGFNLALRDIAALTETLAGADAGGHASADAGRMPADPGDPLVLARYARWRRQDQANVVRFTDGLARLSHRAWLRPLRGLGLQAFDVLPQAKPLLARFALGQGGRMSRLARGLPV